MAGLALCFRMQIRSRHSAKISWIVLFIIGRQAVHGAIISQMLNLNNDHNHEYNISKQNTNMTVATEVNISSHVGDNKDYGYMKNTSLPASIGQTVTSQVVPSAMTQEPVTDSNLSELNESYSSGTSNRLAEVTRIQTTPMGPGISGLIRTIEPEFFKYDVEPWHNSSKSDEVEMPFTVNSDNHFPITKHAEPSRNADLHENRKSHYRPSEISKTLWFSNGRNIHPLNHKLQLVPYEEQPFENYLWKDKKYLVSILIPVGLGILGALMVVVLTYSVRRCAKNNPSVEAAAQQITASISQDFDRRSDQINLLGDATDEDI